MFFLLICGLCSHAFGYHYTYSTPPTTFSPPTSSGGHYESSHPQTGFQDKHSWHTQWHKYEWKNGNDYGTSPTEHNHDMSSPDLISKPNEGINDNSQEVPEDMTEPGSTANVMDSAKRNSTTVPRPTTRPVTRPPTRPPGRPGGSGGGGGPEPGTMSQPVPTLGGLFAPSLQWHVGIYTKRFTPYMQVCGGSLVTADVVLSAAHCFWNDDVGVLRAGLFAVAAGKLLRPWETKGEIYTQRTDIKEIKIPPRFQGVKTSFQDDIAILLLSRPLEYAPGVKPICISFDLETEQKHLTSGNLGTIAGWGLTTPNGPPSQRLNFLRLPYVGIRECIRTAEPSFLKYITSDKICAGDQRTGRALCRGDSGGGLTYYSSAIPYLLGIASTAPRDDNQCNAYAVATFTSVRAHAAFLREHVSGIGEGCEGLYDNGTAIKSGTITGATQNATQTETPTIQEEKKISQLAALPNVTTDERTSIIGTNTNGQVTPVTDQMVTMSVESGKRGEVRVPVEGGSTFVCNCYCKK